MLHPVLLWLAMSAYPAIAADEKLLQEAKVGLDAAALARFLERRIPGAEETERSEQLVRQLGSDRFAVRQKASRELIKLGPPALKALRAAQANPDQEIVRRAKACITTIEGDKRLPGAVVRVLARKAPSGAISVLLAYLPNADDEAVEDEILGAIATLAARPGQADPALTGAIKDAEPARRGAAAFALGRRAEPQSRDLAARLLSDPSRLVRFRAAQGLLAGKDRRAIPGLIELLAVAPDEWAYQAEDMLFRLAGEQAPASPSAATAESRREYREAWAKWWTSHARDLDLAELVDRPPYLGYTVIAQADKVFEWDRAGKVRWKLGDVSMPIEAMMLPNGHVLITENAGRRVTERDLTGKIHWEYKTPDQGLSGRRLANGNTFVVTNSTVAEVSRDGKEVYRHRFPRAGGGNRINSACKLKNGRILVITDGGNMDEMDAATGKLLVAHTAPDRGSYSVEALRGGGWLVAAFSSNKVIEYDAAGKALWEYALPGAFHATRLPNGNTLITSYNLKKVIEVTRARKIVWEKQADNLVWRAHRR